MKDPITGPVPPEVFKAAVEAPAGEAAKMLRKYDPAFGQEPGGKIKWVVTMTRETTEEAEVVVEAETEEDAEDIATGLPDSQLDWEIVNTDAPWVESVEPEAA